uniref:uncharacterized protein LOC125406294 isoform X4 n=1 Tax=Myodes glareolus TaxID=447135 RepID=UPI002021DFC0|nr:uncharacterized protein LOC125406294 isoform X4 [Myodes glareolus]
MDSEQATEKHPGPEFEEDRKDNSLFLLGELKVASKMGASTKGHWSVGGGGQAMEKDRSAISTPGVGLRPSPHQRWHVHGAVQCPALIKLGKT